jgi:hypothetical protein
MPTFRRVFFCVSNFLFQGGDSFDLIIRNISIKILEINEVKNLENYSNLEEIDQTYLSRYLNKVLADYVEKRYKPLGMSKKMFHKIYIIAIKERRTNNAILKID